MSLLLLILLWTPVTENCHGGPETIAAYEVRGQHVMLLGWTQEDPPNPVYSERHPQQGATTLTEWVMSGSSLQPGDVAWWELQAVDTAGNRTNGGCP